MKKVYFIAATKKTYVLLYFAFIVLYFIWALTDFCYWVDAVSFFIYAVSVFFVFVGIYGVSRDGFRTSNIFIISYFSCLALNSLNLSLLQQPKSIIDCYYFFVGALVFYFILCLGERRKVRFKIKPLIRINPNMLGIVLWCVYFVLHIYLFYKTGVRFFSDMWYTSQSVYYRIPGISGLVSVLSWVLLMILPNVKLGYRIIYISTIILFSVLEASRGNITKVVVYLFLYLAFKNSEQLFTKKTILVLTILLIVFFVFFSLWGDYRQMKRGSDISVPYITSLLGSSVNNSPINWAFAYTGMNFDVIKQLVIEKYDSFDVRELFLPIIRLLKGSNGIAEYYDSVKIFGLKGLNATTFAGNFIIGMGTLYFIGIGFLGIVVSFLTNFCRTVKAKGCYVFLLMLTCLTFFGNYYYSSDYFFSLLIVLVLYSVFDFGKDSIKERHIFC